MATASVRRSSNVPPSSTSSSGSSVSEFSKGKTIFVLAVVIGCFAILWPKIFYPMLTASLNMGDDGEQCCDVISDKDVNAYKLVKEICGTILNQEDVGLGGNIGLDVGQGDKKSKRSYVPVPPPHVRCRNEILKSCGIDVTTLIQDNPKITKQYKTSLAQLRSYNTSQCLKLHFSLDFQNIGLPRRFKDAQEAPSHMRPERPIHFSRPELMHPAMREKGSAIPHPPHPGVAPGVLSAAQPQRTLDKEARPGPFPGVRPPVGGAGYQQAQPKGGGTMGIIMPIYTIAIVCFFVYTIMKILFRKSDDKPLPITKDFGLDPAHRKFVFSEEYEPGSERSMKDPYNKEDREAGIRRRPAKQRFQEQRSRLEDDDSQEDASADAEPELSAVAIEDVASVVERATLEPKLFEEPVTTANSQLSESIAASNEIENATGEQSGSGVASETIETFVQDSTHASPPGQDLYPAKEADQQVNEINQESEIKISPETLESKAESEPKSQTSVTSPEPDEVQVCDQLAGPDTSANVEEEFEKLLADDVAVTSMTEDVNEDKEHATMNEPTVLTDTTVVPPIADEITDVVKDASTDIDNKGKGDFTEQKGSQKEVNVPKAFETQEEHIQQPQIFVEDTSKRASPTDAMFEQLLQENADINVDAEFEELMKSDEMGTKTIPENLQVTDKVDIETGTTTVPENTPVPEKVDVEAVADSQTSIDSDSAVTKMQEAQETNVPKTETKLPEEQVAEVQARSAVSKLLLSSKSVEEVEFDDLVNSTVLETDSSVAEFEELMKAEEPLNVRNARELKAPVAPEPVSLETFTQLETETQALDAMETEIPTEMKIPQDVEKTIAEVPAIPDVAETQQSLAPVTDLPKSEASHEALKDEKEESKPNEAQSTDEKPQTPTTQIQEFEKLQPDRVPDDAAQTQQIVEPTGAPSTGKEPPEPVLDIPPTTDQSSSATTLEVEPAQVLTPASSTDQFKPENPVSISQQADILPGPESSPVAPIPDQNQESQEVPQPLESLLDQTPTSSKDPIQEIPNLQLSISSNASETDQSSLIPSQDDQPKPSISSPTPDSTASISETAESLLEDVLEKALLDTLASQSVSEEGIQRLLQQLTGQSEDSTEPEPEDLTIVTEMSELTTSSTPLIDSQSEATLAIPSVIVDERPLPTLTLTEVLKDEVSKTTEVCFKPIQADIDRLVNVIDVDALESECRSDLGVRERDARDIEIEMLRKRLEETEAAMERIVSHMGTVSERLSPSPKPNDLAPVLQSKRQLKRKKVQKKRLERQQSSEDKENQETGAKETVPKKKEVKILDVPSVLERQSSAEVSEEEVEAEEVHTDDEEEEDEEEEVPYRPPTPPKSKKHTAVVATAPPPVVSNFAQLLSEKLLQEGENQAAVTISENRARSTASPPIAASVVNVEGSLELENGRKLRSPTPPNVRSSSMSPVPPPAASSEDAEEAEVPSIFLQGRIPAQASKVLVSGLTDSPDVNKKVDESQKVDDDVEDDSISVPVVLSGKVTLSVIAGIPDDQPTEAGSISFEDFAKASSLPGLTAEEQRKIDDALRSGEREDDGDGTHFTTAEKLEGPLEVNTADGLTDETAEDISALEGLDDGRHYDILDSDVEDDEELEEEELEESGSYEEEEVSEECDNEASPKTNTKQKSPPV